MIAPAKTESAKVQRRRRSSMTRTWPFWAVAVLLAAGCAIAIWITGGGNGSGEIDAEASLSTIHNVGEIAGGTRADSNSIGSGDVQTGDNSGAGATNGNVNAEDEAPKVDPRMVGRLVKPPARKKLFKHVSDAQIGRVLSIRPGGLILGTLNYHRNHFVENFRKSLEDPEPVVFSDDDTPEEAELKAAVIEARAELKAALDRGEDIAEIMQEAEAELHEMQQYRMAMREQMLSYQKEDGVTVEDLEDFDAAVNQMLSEKGIKPVRSAKLQAIKARLHREKNL